MMRVQEPGIPPQQLSSLVESARECFTPDRLLGVSGVMQRVRDAVMRCTENRKPVMLRGAPGTGKARTASTIHYSSQATGPYFTLRCDSLPADELSRELFGCAKKASGATGLERPGLVQIAAGGTIYLEDVDALPKELQERVLKVLTDSKSHRDGGRREERCDVRILSSISCAWDEAKKKLIPGLGDELTGAIIELPELNDRIEDIQALVRGLLMFTAERRECRSCRTRCFTSSSDTIGRRTLMNSLRTSNSPVRERTAIRFKSKTCREFSLTCTLR